MGTFKSNLRKISQLSSSGKTTGAAILTGVYLLLLWSTVANSLPAAPSSPLSDLLGRDDSDESDSRERTKTKYPSTSTTSPGPAPPYHPIVLDDIKDPEVTWELKDSENAFVFNISKASKEFRIAIHLKDCDFDTDDYIKIKTSDGREDDWYCSKKTINSGLSSNDFPLDYKPQEEQLRVSSDRHSGNSFVTVDYVMDNIEQVWITPHLKHYSGHEKWWKDKIKAVIIINLYRDFNKSDSCPDGYFNCHQTPCPSTCCSDGGSSSTSGSNQKSMLTAFWHKRSSGSSRCIRQSLKCNDNPNCGIHANIDERNQICHPEKFCQCEKLCLTWNYVLTSLAIAVLFIITPTAIVFALFHRRNVALERARLIRLAQMRMADMRGDFTREDPTHDTPPTYDEVYDIKEPPPCFCQAVAMQMEYDLQQEEQENSAEASSGQAQDDDRAASQGVRRIDFQNLGFECSCRNVSSGDAGEPSTEDIPPSYIEVHGTNDVDDNNDRSHQRIRGGVRDISPINPAVFENVDLNKEEDV